jgi:hypothetical protein
MSAPFNFPTRPGIYNQPFAQYLADDSALNSGAVKDVIMRSPKHARTRSVGAGSPSAAMRIGTGLHMKVLEPWQYDQEVGVYSDGRRDPRTKPYQDFLKANGYKHEHVLTPIEHGRVVRMAAALERDQNAWHLLTRGIPESTLYARDTETNLWLRARPDTLHADRIVDLKTVTPKHFRALAFREHARKFGYHWQVGFYAHVAQLLSFDIRSAQIVSVESDSPFDVAVYRIERDELDELVVAIRGALRTYAHCLLTNEWPGVSGNTELDLFNKGGSDE